MDIDIMKMALGGVALVLGWFWSMLLSLRKDVNDLHRQRGLTYEEAERLIDLKMRPLADATTGVATAVDRLTQELMKRGRTP